jgi:hypothetical protein
LVGDPVFEFDPVDRRQFHQVGTQPHRFADVNVVNILLRQSGVPMHQHANAERQPARDGNLVRAEQGDIEPPQLPGRQRRKLGVEIRGRREDRAADVLLLDSVAANHQRKQLPRRREDLLTVVVVDRRCSADASALHAF